MSRSPDPSPNTQARPGDGSDRNCCVDGPILFVVEQGLTDIVIDLSTLDVPQHRGSKGIREDAVLGEPVRELLVAAGGTAVIVLGVFAMLARRRVVRRARA